MHFLCLLGKCTFDPVQKMAAQKRRKQTGWLDSSTETLDHNLPNLRGKQGERRKLNFQGHQKLKCKRDFQKASYLNMKGSG